ncbi:HTH domain-containing protein [Halomarina litorea]|uniref:HTH domain-containing protein n=1 Tax=Halomarina litorea TaxID=2961595 RepID=UPI0020C21791|nr:HTH domain-containing protein [Halomarina sp. BCD28]
MHITGDSDAGTDGAAGHVGRQRAVDPPGGGATGGQRGRHVELWVRGRSPYCVRDAEEETGDRLRRLVEGGAIDSFAVRQWTDVGSGTRTGGVADVATSHRKVVEFEAWANDRGYRLSPGFRTHELQSMVGHSVRRKLVSPVLCLAVYDGDTLDAVFPHADEGDVHTVADGLGRLARGGTATSHGGEVA